MAGARRREDHRRSWPAHSAGCHRHAGAFPRAWARAQGRSPVGQPLGGAWRRHRRVRDAEYEAGNSDRRGACRQGRARAGTHVLRLRLFRRRDARECRGASTRWKGFQAPPASRCSWARPPETFSSTTRRRLPASLLSSSAAPPFMPRTKRACASGHRFAATATRQATANGATPEAALAATAKLLRLATAAGKRVHVLHVSTAAEMAAARAAQGCGERRGDAAASDPRRAGNLSEARHQGADEPAASRRRASERPVVGARPGRGRRARLGPRAAYARRKGARAIRRRPQACLACRRSCR